MKKKITVTVKCFIQKVWTERSFVLNININITTEVEVLKYGKRLILKELVVETFFIPFELCTSNVWHYFQIRLTVNFALKQFSLYGPKWTWKLIFVMSITEVMFLFIVFIL